MALVATTGDLIPGPRLLAECFAPAATIVKGADLDQLRQMHRRLQHALAATITSGGPQDGDLQWLARQLAAMAGCVVVNDWPAGVAAGNWSQHHGGPWPAIRRPDDISVGAGVSDRFTRPVAFRGASDSVVRPPVQNAHRWAVRRRVNGRFVLATEPDTDTAATAEQP